MSKAPWYKRYAADFVSDPYVNAMTAEQYGWYSAMLDMSWIHTPIGRLPNDLHLICRMIGRCDEMYFAQHSKIVIDRFKVSDDGLWLYHPKMIEQGERVCEVSENKSHPNKAGRKPRPASANHLISPAQSDDYQMEIRRGVDSDSDSDSDIKTNKEEAVIELPLNAGTHPVTESEVANWSALYPAVDVPQELRRMKGWLQSHPSRRKTKRGVAAFVNSWLSREQDESGLRRSEATVGMHAGAAEPESEPERPLCRICKHPLSRDRWERHALCCTDACELTYRAKTEAEMRQLAEGACRN